MVRKSIRPATAGPVSPTTSVLHNPQPWHVPASAAIDSFVHQPCERPTGRRRRGGRRRWALPVPGSVPNEAPSKQSEAQTILAGQRINKPSTWNRYLPPQLELSSFSPREAHTSPTHPVTNTHTSEPIITATTWVLLVTQPLLPARGTATAGILAAVRPL